MIAYMLHPPLELYTGLYVSDLTRKATLHHRRMLLYGSSARTQATSVNKPGTKRLQFLPSL